VLFLLLEGLFVPLKAKADIFSTLFGNNASADAFIPSEVDANSQNMGLLQANISPVAILESKKNESGDEKIEGIKDLNIVSDNALLASTGPNGVSDGTDVRGVSPDEISVYVVRKGDSVSQIAEMFGVSVDTILWSNDMKKSDKLAEGDILIILPFDGVIHTVAKGDTLSKIAQKYKVEISNIVGSNDVTADAQLSIGDELIIPGGEIKTTTASKSTTKYIRTPTKNIPGYFINPVPNYKKRSQNLHGHNGVDLAASTGTKIVASASGVVIFARNGYNGGYGNMIIIQHPNGTKTLYAHMSKLSTRTGAQVSQGEIIGYVGSTGRSTGPHLHFEVQGAKNPGATTPMSFAQ